MAKCENLEQPREGLIRQELITYEKKNSPISYSSSPGAWSDGTIGAVD